MRCTCNTPHNEVSPVTYTETEEYFYDGRRNPYYDKIMVSHLTCNKCGGNICVSTMTIDEYYRIMKSK